MTKPDPPRPKLTFPPQPQFAPTKAARRRISGSARWGLGLSITAIILWVIPFFGLLLAIGAFVLDMIAMRTKQLKRVWVTGISLASFAIVLALAMTAAQLVPLSEIETQGQRTGQKQAEAVAENAVLPTPTPMPTAKTSPKPVREYWEWDGRFPAPQFVGMNLADAKELAEKLNLRISDDDDSGENRSVWIASNWVVVTQDEPPGSFMEEEGDQIFVSVLKADEVTTEIATGQKNVLLHTGERMFSGVVTGYRIESYQGLSTVYVDDRPVELDLIAPVAPLCAAPSATGVPEALAALQNALPVGQRALVLMNELGKDQGFVHVLPDGGNEPAVQRPADSVNERLVRTGWWVPNVISGGPGLYGDMRNPESYKPYEVAPLGNPLLDLYAPHIAAAGSETAANYVAGAGDCRRSAEVEAEEWRQLAVESREFEEQYWREQEQRQNQGYCRDGDGDGLCNEG